MGQNKDAYSAEVTIDNTVEIDQVLEPGRHEILTLQLQPLDLGSATVAVDDDPCETAPDLTIWSEDAEYGAVVREATVEVAEISVRGDAAEDADVNIADVDRIIQYIENDRHLWCWALADVNDDDFVNVDDAVYLFNCLFKEGPAPPEPFATPVSEFVCDPV